MKKYIRYISFLFLLFGFQFLCLASEKILEEPEPSIIHRMTNLVIQLAVILCAAKISGFLCRKYLRIPEVVGELVIGIIIGPYMLGAWLGLFPAVAAGAFPISPELYGIATFASILLLYLAGLETDLPLFLQYSVAGSVVGITGVVVSFAIGNVTAVILGFADSFMSPAALFLGTISTATSVGITARILNEKNKLDSPEGVTILAGAVVDDVLGIIILAIVIGTSNALIGGGQVNWMKIGFIAAKAISFWLICTALGMLLARKISRFLEFFGSRQTMATLSLGMALLLAGFSEKAGLAMIIGAYIMGLSLSRCDAAHELRHRLEPVYNTLVSVFFVVLGMMVDIAVIKGALLFGVIYTLFAMIAKIVGCGGPALFLGFTPRGAFRIGVGMLPRGEVTLIVAGIGLSMGLIAPQIFGVAVLMTLISTLVAPLIMFKIFNEHSGLTDKRKKTTQVRHTTISLDLPNPDVAAFLLSRVNSMFEQEDCYVHRVVHDQLVYQIRKEEIIITAKREENKVVIISDEKNKFFVKLILLEALANLITVFEGLREISQSQIKSQIMA